jgi:hypothetical protein
MLEVDRRLLGWLIGKSPSLAPDATLSSCVGISGTAVRNDCLDWGAKRSPANWKHNPLEKISQLEQYRMVLVLGFFHHPCKIVNCHFPPQP